MCLSDEIAVVMIRPFIDVLISASKRSILKWSNGNAPYVFAFDSCLDTSYQRIFVFSREYENNTKKCSRRITSFPGYPPLG